MTVFFVKRDRRSAPARAARIFRNAARGLAFIALASGLTLGARAAEPTCGERGVADLVAKIRPAVVDIDNRGVAKGGEDDPRAPVRIRDDVGAGFIVDPTGLIVTNSHVVDGAYALFVTLSDGRRLPAQLVGKALTFDVALLKIDAGAPLPAVRFGVSANLRVGDRVIAIGNPQGFAGSVSSGIVSALHRAIGLSSYDDLIQTDATINQGNSGGPLFNCDGEAIGVNQAIYTKNAGGSIGIGFAIPIDDVKNLTDDVLNHGRPRFGWLGAGAQFATPSMARALDAPGRSGALVASLAPGGPAERAGLRVGDLLTRFNDAPLDSVSALNRLVARSAGRNARIAYVRQGVEATATVAIGEWPKATWESRMEAAPRLNDYADYGVAFVDTAKGPQVENVVEKSVAWTGGLRKGDVVRQVGDRPIRTIAEMGGTIDEMFNKKGKTSALLLVSGANGDRWLDIAIAQ